MHRKTVHRWIAALALVATLGLVGARPAAAADLSSSRVMDRLASLWSVVTERPAALWDALIGWIGGPENPSRSNQKSDTSWGSDPNGNPTTVTGISSASSEGTN